MLPLGYLQHDAERDAVLTFPADVVKLLHIGAPAVDAADAAGCAQDRHARAARGGQLGDVLGGLDLLRGVGQYAEGKRRVGLFNRQRSRRDVDKLKLAGRSAEIQRLIGRSLRAAVDLEALGERTVTVDCDVLQGDGGTRTASITGGFVALALACRKLLREGKVERNPIVHQVAAVSAGIIDDVPMLDLPYSEDSRAQVDLNCVMNEQGELIEIQGTGEGRSFTLSEQQELVRLCGKGIAELMEKQREMLR